MATVGTQGRRSQTPSFTYEVDCLVEPGADVRFVVVLHRNALVLVVTLKVVRTVGRDVDQGSDAQGIKHVLPGSMIGTAQVQEGQDLHWAPWNAKQSSIHQACSESTPVPTPTKTPY